MRIVILGAGQVGAALARNLAFDNDITLIDLDEKRLRDLQNRLDIKTILGCGSHPKILIEGGIQQADMLIAVTNSDEVNMMGCQIAYSLFRTPTKIARIRSRYYYDYPELFCNAHIPVDVCISPEQLVTEHIVNLIEYPGVAQIFNFAEGRVLLVTIKSQRGELMIGKTVQQLDLHLQSITASVVAVFRNKIAIPLENNPIIARGDEVIFIASASAIQKMLITLDRYTHPNRRIIIAGGGHIGTALAQSLENKYRIKIIDHDHLSTNNLAALLHKATVLQGDIADRDLLINENIEFTDLFCAVTNDDETNIMSCLQAKRLGARHAMALVNRNTYVDLIDEINIDHAISPQRIMIGSILTKIRRGNMIRVYRLHHEAEAIELIIHGDELTSQVIGRPLNKINFPPCCLIAAIVRGEKVEIATGELILAAGDHVILLILQRRYVHQIESLFQVNLSLES